MNNSSIEIARLCESCWEQLADSAKTEQRPYIEELLHLLGWKQLAPYTPKKGTAVLSGTPYLLRAGGQTAVATFFTMPGILDPPSVVRERGLDFCAATRVLTDEAHAVGANYTLVTDLQRSYLYDVRTDELIAWADSPKVFNEDIAPLLVREEVERGILEEARRQPRSVVARYLREWMLRHTSRIATAGVSEETAGLGIDRLIVVRYLFDHLVLQRTKWQFQQRFAALVYAASSNRPQGCGAELVRLFHDMWLDWKFDIFSPAPELDRILENDAAAAPLLRDIPLISRSKFSIPTVLEAFNYGDPSEKMRVRMVPDENEERDAYLSRQTLETVDVARLEMDLVEEGYRAMFYWFDKMIALYERQEVDYVARVQLNERTPVDLFEWSALDAKRPRACSSKFAHACERGFGAYFNTPRQFRVARLMMTLHLIMRYHKAKIRVDRFPKVDEMLMKRPRILPVERLMNGNVYGQNIAKLG